MYASKQALMSVGATPLMADQVGYEIKEDVAAAGTDQAGATALPNTNCIVIVSSGSTNGVRLPSIDVASFVLVRTASGIGTTTVYPSTGEAINSGSANNGVTMGAGSSRIFIGALFGSTKRWVSI